MPASVPASAKLGFLYPGHSGEDDYRAFANSFPEVQVIVEHTSVGQDAHEEDALRDLGAMSRLLEGGASLRRLGADCVVWACTSGSFVFGLDGAREQAANLGAAVGLPASSTSLAFLNALAYLGLRRVSVLATYPVDVANMFVDFLGQAGLVVVQVRSLGLMTGAAVSELDIGSIIRLAGEADLSGVDVLLMPDTALRTAEFLDDLEHAARKPVLTANQVTMWQALRLTGANTSKRSMGSLFANDSRSTHPLLGLEG